MEASCEAYLKALNDDIEGGMGFIFTSWDNTDGGFNLNESSSQCSSPATSCDNVSSLISNFKVYQWGYTEDIPAPTPDPTPPTPDPSPQPSTDPAEILMFNAESS